MDLRLLGPVEVHDRGCLVPLGGIKPKTLLAALLLDTGRIVTVERLLAAVWQDDPPSTARGILQTYIASLRRAFSEAGLPTVIVSRQGGYLAQTPPDTLDKAVFERLVAEARRAAREGGHREAAGTFRAALALWRGPALGDTSLSTETDRLESVRLGVVEERVAADLAAGYDDGLVDELTELVEAHPARERLRSHLMVALYRSGRQSDALSVYQRGRQALVDELGIEPGPELRRTHESILRSDQTLLAVATTPPPRQLPSPPSDFTGRDDELATLRDRFTRPGALPVSVIFGPGGVGKSALALRAAHEIAHLYPDGQFHVDLRGTSPTPATSQEVLTRILRELAPGAPQPATLEESAARFRTLLADRRKLVVLEDAASEQQVRPLLPGSPGCGVIVTSRNRLAGLAGATVIDLGLLPEASAVELLGRIAGPVRFAAAPEAARRIVEHCGGLPLALRIAATRLASRPHWTAARLADRLADERRRLDELAVGDQDVRARLALGYDLLPQTARTALRRLGLLGPSFSVGAAAAALDTDPDEAERILEDLVDASLVRAADTYRLHDLTRLFAWERAHAEETAAECAAVVDRVERSGEAVPAEPPATTPRHPRFRKPTTFRTRTHRDLPSRVTGGIDL
ncbi:AfsR/SARP family transcriptional regulator [Herbidospora sp. RD11066]